MFGPNGFIIIGLALATAVALLLLVIVFRPFRGVIRTVTRSFWCAVRGQNVTAEFQEAAWDGKPVEVTRCSAFSPPEAIACEKLCLHPEQFHAAAKHAKAV